MPPNPHPRCMKLLERHVECGPQLRTTAGVWGRRAPQFLVSRSSWRLLPKLPIDIPRGPRFGMQIKEQGAFLPVAYSRTSLAEKRRSDAELRPKRGIAGSASPCLFRGSRACARGVTPLRSRLAILTSEARIGQCSEEQSGRDLLGVCGLFRRSRACVRGLTPLQFCSGIYRESATIGRSCWPIGGQRRCQWLGDTKQGLSIGPDRRVNRRSADST